jgi:hypothetical protein
MIRRKTRVLAGVGVAVLAVGGLTACSGSKAKPVSASSSVAPSATSSAPAPVTTSAAPKPTTPAAVNPLTGGAVSSSPVIAVKIDDTEHGRPQLGIDKADIVYIEQAEGGLSRLIGVFGTNKPVVGYVRSTRPSDPELLLQYGKITLAASGGGGDSLPLLDSSGLRGWINDRGAAYYVRASHYNDSGYVNLTLDLAKVAATAKGPAAQSIGFQWSKAISPTLAAGRGSTLVTQVGSTTVDFRYSARLGKYVRFIDGVAQTAADGNAVATPNVIVQSCIVTPHPGDVDVNGNPSQFTTTTGSGKVVVFRNGHSVTGTWSRTGVNNGTVLRDSHGKVIPLAPGGAWVVLSTAGVPLTVS